MQLDGSIAFPFLFKDCKSPKRYTDSAGCVTGVLYVIKKVEPEKTFENCHEPAQKKDVKSDE